MSDGDKSVDIRTDPVSEINCSNCSSVIDVEGIDRFIKVECPECHNMEVVPARLGPFLLLELIGSGGMGGVYRARDESLGRMVAIKVMLKSYGDDSDFVEKFKKEAQATAKLNHPNIVQIYSFGQEKGQPYIVMEFIGGRRFDKMVDAGEPLNPALVLKIGIDAAQGLSAAEEAGLIHGDIKPENVLLDEKMQAKIVDFGIASVANEQESGGIWGTPYYIAPEKVKRQKVDSRADIYSLGATMYHALAGRPPFEGKTPIEVVKARFETAPPDLQRVSPKVSREVAGIISRMLQVEPARRYPTYASAISDMRKVLREMGGGRGLGGHKKVKTVVRRKGTSGPGKAPVRVPTKKNVTRISTERPAQNYEVQHDEGTSTGDALAEYRQRALGGGQAQKKKKTGGKKVGSKVFLWFLLIIVLLGGVGGGAAYLIGKRQRTIRIRKEFIALARAKDSSAEFFSRIALSATNLNELGENAEQRIAAATNAAVYVTGEPITIAKPVPLEPEEETKSEDQAAGETNGEEQEAAAKEKKIEETIKKPDKSDLQHGVMTKEALERQRAKHSTAAQNKKEKEKEEKKKPEEEPEPEEQKREPVKKEPEIVELTREVVEYANRIIVLSKEGKSIFESSVQLAEKAEDSTRSIEARKIAGMLEINMNKMDSMLAESEDLLEQTDEPMEEIEEILEKEKKIREAREKARLEKERKEKEKAERLRREREHKAKVKRELENARNELREARRLLSVHKYGKAVKRLSREKSSYTTDEGKAAFETVIERYRLLEDTKEYIIKRLSKKSMPWGWIRGDGQREDVLGANEKHIRLKGRKVPWEKINARQMLSFINYYLARRDTMTLRQLGKYSLGAAVYSKEHGAEKTAQKFLDKAISHYPRINEKAEVVMDDVLEDGESSESETPEDNSGDSGFGF